jgi:hypothetical protein
MCLARKEKTMKSSAASGGLDRKVLLSTLWIFAMLNYIYADVLTLMSPDGLNAIMEGSAGSMPITPGFLLVAGILMETAIAMVLLSRILPYGANRWANILVGLLHTLAVLASMFVDTPAPFYVFYGVIEIVCTCAIMWLAWAWRPLAA